MFIRVLIFVLAIHIALVGWVLYQKDYAVNIPRTEKFVVKTVSFKSEQPVVMAESIVKEEIAPSPQPSPPPLPLKKKEIAKKEPVKKMTPKKEPNPKKAVVKKEAPKQKAEPKKNPKLQESIAKIQKNLDKSSTQKQTESEIAEVKEIAALHINSVEILSASENGYYGALIGCLKSNLKLPEVGDVKVRLTVERSGKVRKIEILESKNQKNRSYLEKQLTKISLPPFGLNFKGEEHRTFTLTLTNN